jgi:hypothetical protein
MAGKKKQIPTLIRRGYRFGFDLPDNSGSSFGHAREPRGCRENSALAEVDRNRFTRVFDDAILRPGPHCRALAE